MKLFFLVKNYANFLLLLLITRRSQRFFFVKHCNISIRCGNCKNSDALRINVCSMKIAVSLLRNLFCQNRLVLTKDDPFSCFIVIHHKMIDVNRFSRTLENIT